MKKVIVLIMTLIFVFLTSTTAIADVSWTDNYGEKGITTAYFGAIGYALLYQQNGEWKTHPSVDEWTIQENICWITEDCSPSMLDGTFTLYKYCGNSCDTTMFTRFHPMQIETITLKDDSVTLVGTKFDGIKEIKKGEVNVSEMTTIYIVKDAGLDLLLEYLNDVKYAD